MAMAVGRERGQSGKGGGGGLGHGGLFGVRRSNFKLMCSLIGNQWSEWRTAALWSQDQVFVSRRAAEF